MTYRQYFLNNVEKQTFFVAEVKAGSFLDFGVGVTRNLVALNDLVVVLVLIAQIILQLLGLISVLGSIRDDLTSCRTLQSCCI